jgi:hypothetical protein
MVFGLDPSSSDSYLCEALPPIKARNPSGSGARACLARLSASASCPSLSNIAASHKIAPESRQLRYAPVRVRRNESSIGFVRMLSMKRWSRLPHERRWPRALCVECIVGTHQLEPWLAFPVSPRCGELRVERVKNPTRNSQSPPRSDNMGVLCVHQGLSCSTF